MVMLDPIVEIDDLCLEIQSITQWRRCWLAVNCRVKKGELACANIPINLSLPQTKLCRVRVAVLI